MDISPKNLKKLEAVLQSIFGEGFDHPETTIFAYKHDIKEDFINLRGYVDDVSAFEAENKSTISFLAEDFASIIYDMGQVARKELKELMDK